MMTTSHNKSVMLIATAMTVAIGIGYVVLHDKNNSGSEQLNGSACRQSSIQQQSMRKQNKPIENPFSYTATEGGKNPSNITMPLSDHSKQTDSDFKNVGVFNGSYPLFGNKDSQFEPGHIARIVESDLVLPYIQRAMYRPNKQRLDATVLAAPIVNDLFFSGPDEAFGNLGMNNSNIQKDMQQMCTSRQSVYYPSADEYVKYGDDKPKFCKNRMSERSTLAPILSKHLQSIEPTYNDSNSSRFSNSSNMETITGMNKWQFGDVGMREFERNTLEQKNLATFSMTSDNGDLVYDRQLRPKYGYGASTNSKFEECSAQLPNLGKDGCKIASMPANEVFN